jgi:hypothetical protein
VLETSVVPISLLSLLVGVEKCVLGGWSVEPPLAVKGRFTGVGMMAHFKIEKVVTLCMRLVLFRWWWPRTRSQKMGHCRLKDTPRKRKTRVVKVRNIGNGNTEVAKGNTVLVARNEALTPEGSI